MGRSACTSITGGVGSNTGAEGSGNRKTGLRSATARPESTEPAERPRQMQRPVGGPARVFHVQDVCASLAGAAQAKNTACSPPRQSHATIKDAELNKTAAGGGTCCIMTGRDCAAKVCFLHSREPPETLIGCCFIMDLTSNQTSLELPGKGDRNFALCQSPVGALSPRLPASTTNFASHSGKRGGAFFPRVQSSAAHSTPAFTLVRSA